MKSRRNFCHADMHARAAPPKLATACPGTLRTTSIMSRSIPTRALALEASREHAGSDATAPHVQNPEAQKPTGLLCDFALGTPSFGGAPRACRICDEGPGRISWWSDANSSSHDDYALLLMLMLMLLLLMTAMMMLIWMLSLMLLLVLMMIMLLMLLFAEVR